MNTLYGKSRSEVFHIWPSLALCFVSNLWFGWVIDMVSLPYYMFGRLKNITKYQDSYATFPSPTEGCLAITHMHTAGEAKQNVRHFRLQRSSAQRAPSCLLQVCCVVVGHLLQRHPSTCSQHCSMNLNSLYHI